MNFIEISKEFRYRKKMLGLDFDHTIVKPKNNKTFPSNKDDWEWLRPNVPETIMNYYNKGYAIVIFTNQFRDFKKEQVKIVLDSIGCPYKAYLAYDKKIKKPSPFLFKQYKRKNFDFNNSFYVGDAMGRIQDWSDSDKLFALNCGLKYKTPEEIFLFPNKEGNIKNTIYCDVGPNEKQELVIMVGFPGSGKSTLTNQFEKYSNYSILHGDDLKTEAKIIKMLNKELENKKSVIIDATNPSIKKRSIFINIAKKYNVYIRIITMNTSMEESMSRNALREKPIPKIAFYMFRKKYEEPKICEGVDEVIIC